MRLTAHNLSWRSTIDDAPLKRLDAKLPQRAQHENFKVHNLLARSHMSFVLLEKSFTIAPKAIIESVIGSDDA